MSIVDVPLITYPPTRAVYPAYGAGTVTLDAAEELCAMVFTVPKSGTLKKIGWRTSTITAGTSYTLKISVETVDTTIGQPVATTNAGKTLYAPGAESADITSGLSSSTVYYTAINGTSGISVTAGDLIAVTFRLTAVNGASIPIFTVSNGNTIALSVYIGAERNYTASYVNSTWGNSGYNPCLSLVYSDGFVPSPYINPACNSVALTWNSGSNPDRRGIKFKVPYKCRLFGVSFVFECDSNVDIILYDSDEYTVISGFPITITSSQRRNGGISETPIIFPTKPELLADTWYRIVILPKTTTNLSMYNTDIPDCDTFVGATNSLEGANLIYTTFNGSPSSGSHSWTDSNNKVSASLLIDGIDGGSSGGGLLIGKSSLIG